MNTFPLNQPLTEAELDSLADFLGRCKGKRAMNLEEFDGFLSALIAGPELVPPSEYLPEVFGESGQFERLDEANHVLGLIMRHWNSIAATLESGDVHLPVLFEDSNGTCRGNDWARGFMRGVEMRRGSWADLITNDEHGGAMIPVLMLYHEHDENPELRPGQIAPERREEIIVQMAAGLVKAYRYFRKRSQPGPGIYAVGPSRPAARVGRNDHCPCGSGKKYKRCCGSATIH